MALRDNNCDRFNSHQNPITGYRSSHKIPCLNWNSHLGGTKFPAPWLYKRWSSFKWISSFRGTISVPVTTQSITFSRRGSSQCWGCTSQCIAMYSFWESTHHWSHHSGKIFVVKLQSTESPHQLSSCFIDALEEELLMPASISSLLHFACLYPDPTWFEYLPPGAVVSWDTIPCLIPTISGSFCKISWVEEVVKSSESLTSVSHPSISRVCHFFQLKNAAKSPT